MYAQAEGWSHPILLVLEQLIHMSIGKCELDFNNFFMS
jgi:hypothetical protein